MRMKFKIYKRRGWARRIAAKHEWHLAEGCRGGWTIRPMTQREISISKAAKARNDIMKEAFNQDVKDLVLRLRGGRQ
jgi:hypothetical protein